MIGDAKQKYLLASDAGYGFIASLGDLVSRNKAGKAILRVPAGGKAVVPAPVPTGKECLIAAVSSIGRLLVFEMDELPELAKGKGNKLINIPGKKYQSGEEKMVAASGVISMITTVIGRCAAACCRRDGGKSSAWSASNRLPPKPTTHLSYSGVDRRGICRSGPPHKPDYVFARMGSDRREPRSRARRAPTVCNTSADRPC
jgi:hypothetical protein